MIVSLIFLAILVISIFIYLRHFHNCFGAPLIVLIIVELFLFSLIIESTYIYEKATGTYVTVKCGDEILYRGNSAFYSIEYNGVSICFTEKDQRVWFPQVLNKRVSNNITVTKEPLNGIL